MAVTQVRDLSPNEVKKLVWGKICSIVDMNTQYNLTTSKLTVILLYKRTRDNDVGATNSNGRTCINRLRSWRSQQEAGRGPKKRKPGLNTIFFKYLFSRKIGKEEEQRREKESQAGFTLSAENLMWAWTRNPEVRTRDKIKSSITY